MHGGGWAHAWALGPRVRLEGVSASWQGVRAGRVCGCGKVRGARAEASATAALMGGVHVQIRVRLCMGPARDHMPCVCTRPARREGVQIRDVGAWLGALLREERAYQQLGLAVRWHGGGNGFGCRLRAGGQVGTGAACKRGYCMCI